MRCLHLLDVDQRGAEEVFEIDDQSPEDLAIGLDRIRTVEGVRDVCQWPALGKKGRMAAAVQVLCEPALIESAARACLSETATIGLRLRVEEMERTHIGRVSLALNEMQRLRWQERYG